MSNYIPEAFRKVVKARAESRCEYCQWWAKYCITTFQIDHVLPKAKGGLTVVSNLAYACGACNNFKADRTLGFDDESQIDAPLFNPRTQNWNDHFIWNASYQEIIGTSPTGRVTVRDLKVNRAELMTMRRIFRERGEHPPVIE